MASLISRAASLWQPYATLAVLGLKRNETRSWYTSFRGPLAIHATAHTPADVLARCAADPHIVAALHKAGLSMTTLPRGAVVGVATVATVAQIQEHPQDFAGLVLHPDELSPQERAFGDYRHGRYAWGLQDNQALSLPVPCAGRQRLWQLPEDVQRQLAILLS
jgi:activating signal cointegrator 1